MFAQHSLASFAGIDNPVELIPDVEDLTAGDNDNEEEMDSFP